MGEPEIPGSLVWAGAVVALLGGSVALVKDVLGARTKLVVGWRWLWLSNERERLQSLSDAVSDVSARIVALERRASSSSLKPTVLHLGVRWGSPELGEKNIAYCPECHSKGRLYPLEKLDDGKSSTVGLKCLHSDHGKEFAVLVRDRRAFEKFEATVYTDLRGKGEL